MSLTSYSVEHRRTVVQQGGTKALVKLSLNNTEEGRAKAAHALAKIALSVEVWIAFPGQRVSEK